MQRRTLLGGFGAGMTALAAGRARAALEYYDRKPIRPDTVNVVGQDLDTILERGVIRIAVYEDFAPFSWRSGREPHGIDVVLAETIAERLGVSLRLMMIHADEDVAADLRNYIWRGPVVGGDVANVMLHVPYARSFNILNEMAHLFGLYHEEVLALAVDPEKLDPGDGVLGLDAELVAVEVDTIGDVYLSSFQGGRLRETVTRHRTPELAVRALVEGRVGAAMGPMSQLEGLLGEERRRFRFVTGPFPGLAIAAWPIGAAVHISYRDVGYEVGDIITDMVQTGRMAEIFADHGVTWRQPAML